jgi:hypothetical protein
MTPWFPGMGQQPSDHTELLRKDTIRQNY